MIALADATAPLELVVPLCDAREAFLVRGDAVHGVSSLAELAQILRARSDVAHHPARATRPRRRPICPTWPTSGDSPSGATPSRWRPPVGTTC